MPILTMRISPSGALLTVLVGCSFQRLEALRKVGKAAPSSVQATALVDSGASCTAIDERIISQLQLTPSGETTIQTPSTGTEAHRVLQYDVSILVPTAAIDPGLLVIRPALAVVGCELRSQGIDALIGRDVLDQGLFHYNGLAQLFTLAF